MISLSDDLDLDVSDENSLSDFVDRASKHHWQVWFKFESGHRDPTYKTNGKKYGSNKTFRQIYNELKKKGQDFIDVYFNEIYPYSDVKELGDELLVEINNEVGIIVDSIKTAKDEVFPISKKAGINYTRMRNAEERLDIQREVTDSLHYEVSRLEETLKTTKSGAYDRRTSSYRQYSRALDELYNAIDDYDRAKASYERETVRYQRSLERKHEVISNLSNLRNGKWETIDRKYESSAREFAESIKDDIVNKARTGELPMQNLDLAESTIKKRLKAGLSASPRFWATTQLVNSIIVTCTLV